MCLLIYQSGKPYKNRYIKAQMYKGISRKVYKERYGIYQRIKEDAECVRYKGREY